LKAGKRRQELLKAGHCSIPKQLESAYFFKVFKEFDVPGAGVQCPKDNCVPALQLKPQYTELRKQSTPLVWNKHLPEFKQVLFEVPQVAASSHLRCSA
jgi:hypothetical protein